MLTQIHEPFEPLLRQRDVDFVVDLGQVQTGAELFGSDHEVSDGKDYGEIREAIGIEGFIGDDLL
jgi:hypothetical protein